MENPKTITTLALFGQLISRQLEAGRREVELQRAHDALQRRNAQLRTFASVASHDLRSPLRGIGNLAAWADEDLASGGASAAREHLKQISTSVRRNDALGS